jgi:hypothetical protein
MSTVDQPEIGFVITNPLTGHPKKETPDGISLEGKVFQSKEDAEAFIFKHWKNAVLCEEHKL